MAEELQSGSTGGFVLSEIQPISANAGISHGSAKQNIAMMGSIAPMNMEFRIFMDSAQQRFYAGCSDGGCHNKQRSTANEAVKDGENHGV